MNFWMVWKEGGMEVPSTDMSIACCASQMVPSPGAGFSDLFFNTFQGLIDVCQSIL